MQPSLSQLRRVSEDVVQRYQVGDTCTSLGRTSYGTPFSHRAACQSGYLPFQPVCPQVCQAQDCEWAPPYPCVAPKRAEKLNIGSAGQLGPNMNDSRCSLQDAVRTVADLVDLINSAADDLGVDLDRKPTAQDDEEFMNAPFEHFSQASSWSSRSIFSEKVNKNIAEEEQLPEDTWL